MPTLQQQLNALRARVPPGCPLRVEPAHSGFEVIHTEGRVNRIFGPWEHVAAYIDGYVRGWSEHS